MSEENYWTRRMIRRLSRRRVLAGGVAAGAAWIAAACGGGSNNRGGAATATKAAGAASGTAAGTAAASAAASAQAGQAGAKQPKKGGTLKWGIEADVASLDPVWTTATVTSEMALNLYDQLFIWDANQKPQPVLVKDYAISPDNLTYTFNLRQEATFDGGRPILAADVVPSVLRWSKNQASGISMFKVVNSWEAKDDHTVVLELKEPYSLVIDSFSTGFGAPFIMTKEAASTAPDQRVDDVTASGPFKLQEWTKGSRLVLKRRDDYKSPPGTPSNLAGARTVYLDSVEIPIIPDQNSRLSALQAGTIDLMTQPLSDYYDQLKGDPNVSILVNGLGSYNVVLLNNTRPPFNNPLARQAVLAATDIDKFMTAGWGKNLWKPCPAIFLCGSPNESKASIDQYNRKDLTKAKQLFQQLQQSGGYDGRPITLLANTTYTWMLNESQVTKQMLESIGFKVDYQTPDWATAVSIRPSKDKWDLFHTGGVHGPGGNDPLRSLPLNPTWFGWYQSAEMDDLKHQYGLATTPDQQKQVLDKVQTLWYKDVPDLLLGVAQFYDAFHTYVKGYNNSPNQTSFWNVWLDR
ncbi:MAG TPA: ABC transporter substrate-binding protein [Dehalococcoidia bacterium]|nr:ABC transporter substrate-binding protein [Dehalococcoidia bacterium]